MAEKKMAKGLKEGDDNTIVIKILGGNLEEVEFCFTDLPEGIQTKLGPFGLSHKLGDAAAGKRGPEAEEAIQKVWNGLLENNWSVRAPASPKISTKTILTNLDNLPEEEKEKAIATLAALGITIPGLTVPNTDDDNAAGSVTDDNGTPVE